MKRGKSFGRVLLGTLLLTWLIACTPSGPTIATPSPLPNGIAGRPYAVGLKAEQGKLPLIWSGSPAAGLALDTRSGELTGTPERAGSFHFPVTVTDGRDRSHTKTFELRVVPFSSGELAITSPSPLPQGIRGQAYSHRLEARGGQGQLRWSSGNLADDFSLDPARGIVTATPKRDGTFTFDVSVTDEEKQCSAKRFQLTVIGLDIVTRDLPAATPETDYEARVEVEGGIPPLTWFLASGALPGGLNLDGQTGEITGKPTSASATPFSFEVRVTDSASPVQSDTQFLEISVQEPGVTVSGAAPAVWVIAVNGVDQPGTTANVKPGDTVQWRYRSGVPSHGVGFEDFPQAQNFLTFDPATGPIVDQPGFPGPNPRGTMPISTPNSLMLRATVGNEPSGTELDFFCTLHGTAMSGTLRMQ